MRTRIAMALLAVLAVFVATPGVAGATGPKYKRQPTIVDRAVANPDLSILVQAVTKAGLAGTLADPKAQLTVFAPTNAAFAALLKKLGVASLNDIPIDTLKKVLLNHVVKGKVSVRDLERLDRRDRQLTALGGLSLDFDRKPLRVNGVKVVVPQVWARNGVVHVIDQVLLDPDPRPSIAALASSVPELSILVQAVTRAGLVGAISDPKARLTVFAPTNAAFAALLKKLGVASLNDIPVDTLKKVLLDHVVGRELNAPDVLKLASKHRSIGTLGGLQLQFTNPPLKVNGVNIVAPENDASNGVVHVIDQVLLRPAS